MNLYSANAMGTDSNTRAIRSGARTHHEVRWMTLLTIAIVIAVFAVEYSALRLRYFVNDDYQMIYSAWLRSAGLVPGRDFAVQSFHLLPDLLRPLLMATESAPERLWIIRVPFLGCLALLPLLAYFITYRAFSSIAAPFGALASLLSWATLERSLDIRPDLIIALLLLLQLALTLGRNFTHRHAFVIGVLMSLMLILRLKMLVFLPLPIFWILVRSGPVTWKRLREDRIWLRDIGFLATGLAATTAASVCVLHFSGLLPFFVDGNLSLALLAKQAMGNTELQRRTFSIVLRRDSLWLLLFVIGVGSWTLRSGLRTGRARPLSLLLAGVGYVFLNPAFYAYNLLLLIPLWSAFVGFGCATLLRWTHCYPARNAVALLLTSLWVAWYSPLLVGLATRATNHDQVQLIEALQKTTPNTHVFALEGVGLFRPSLFDWRLSAISLGLYQQGHIDLQSQLASRLPEIVIQSYRIPGWLSTDDRIWLFEHYVRLSPQLLILGKRLEANDVSSLRVLRESSFEIKSGTILLNDVWYSEGSVVALVPGTYQLEASNSAAVIRFHWPEGIALANAERPYLIAPDSSLYE